MLFATWCTAQQGNSTFEIRGEISYPLADSVSKVYLHYFYAGTNYSDSASVIKGSFMFKGSLQSVAQATLVPYYKYLSKRENISIFRKDNRKIQLAPGSIGVSIDRSFRDSKITGSPLTTDFDIYDAFMQPSIDNNEKVYQDTRKEPASEARSIKKRAASQAIVTARKDFVRKYPSNSFAINAMKEALQDFQNDKLFKPAADSIYDELIALNSLLDPKLKATPEGKELDLRLKELSSRKLPHFSGPSMAGGTLDISNYKGRVFLIDFWGSWCVWCRKGHPHLKEVYEKFKPKGLEIIGVGVEFDKDRAVGERKLREAMMKDGISWPQIYNINDGENDLRKIFSIYAYPTKILVDTEGNIVLRVTDDEERKLDAKLEELLGR